MSDWVTSPALGSEDAGITIRVDGQDEKLSYDELAIYHPEAERQIVLAQMARWGDIAVSAEAELEELEARLGHWEAQQIKALMNESAGKVAEWKVKPLVHSEPEYLEKKLAIVRARARAKKAAVAYRALGKKSDVLQANITRENAGLRGAAEVSRQTDPGEPDPRYAKFREARAQKRP